MKNILVVNVNWVGDVIFSTPIFRALKEEYPDSKISCLAVPRVKDVCESCSFIDEIIIYDEKGTHRFFLGKLKLVIRLCKKKFDIAFILHRSWTRALLVFLAGIPERVGYDTKNRGKFLTQRIELPEEGLHRCDFYLTIIESYGIQVKDRHTELKVFENAKREVEHLLWDVNISKEDVFVIVNAGGNWDLKRWPKENFSKLIRQIVNELHVKVVIPGALKDVRLANEIREESGVGVVSLAGKTNLKQLIALMQRANLVVSSDSGPMHIASSVGTETIGIFGPTRAEITGPRGSGKTTILQKEVGCNKEPCYQLDCGDNICMKAIDVTQVFKEVEAVLSYQQTKK